MPYSTSCAFHLVYGRLSDIFGRKMVLQVAVGILILGNLLCSFAQTPVQLYIFRAISGGGGGGVNGIAMCIVSFFGLIWRNATKARCQTLSL